MHPDAATSIRRYGRTCRFRRIEGSLPSPITRWRAPRSVRTCALACDRDGARRSNRTICGTTGGNYCDATVCGEFGALGATALSVRHNARMATITEVAPPRMVKIEAIPCTAIPVAAPRLERSGASRGFRKAP